MSRKLLFLKSGVASLDPSKKNNLNPKYGPKDEKDILLLLRLEPSYTNHVNFLTQTKESIILV